MGEALASFDRALAIQPNDAEVLNNRANVLCALGRHADALVSYDRALAIMPDYAHALNNRANTLRALDRHEDAIEDLATFIEGTARLRIRPRRADGLQAPLLRLAGL